MFIYVWGGGKERIIKDTRDNICGRLLRDVSLTILLSIASVISRPVNDNYILSLCTVKRKEKEERKILLHRFGKKRPVIEFRRLYAVSDMGCAYSPSLLLRQLTNKSV